MRPDLRWIQDQLAAQRLTFDTYTSDERGFSCQCPVHRGEGKSARFAVRNGVLLFTCYAHHCDFKDMKDALDLTDADIYADYILRDRERERKRVNQVDTSQNTHFIMVAESDLESGKKLSREQMERYQIALLQRAGYAKSA